MNMDWLKLYPDLEWIDGELGKMQNKVATIKKLYEVCHDSMTGEQRLDCEVLFALASLYNLGPGTVTPDIWW